MDEQRCRVCHEVKPRSDFSPSDWKDHRCRPCHAAYLRAYYIRTREDHLRKARIWKQQNHERWSLSEIKRKFGLAPETYLAMREAQSGLCAICASPPGRRRLAVDHDHRTGRVRDLLCNRCNRMLGFVNDDPAILRAMLAYLARHTKIVRIA